MIGLRGVHNGNPPNAEDFMAGLLSLDHTTGDKEENSDQVILLRLMGFRGIGAKSAVGIMAFGHKIPLFIVDAYVLLVCKWLKWAPEFTTEDQTVMDLYKKNSRSNLHTTFTITSGVNARMKTVTSPKTAWCCVRSEA